VTDSLRIVATGLATVETPRLIEFVRDYVACEQVDAVIVGLPRDVHGRDSDSMRYITPGINRLRKELPQLKIEFYDERFTSVIAHRSMIDSGMKKMQRRDKAVVDTMAAAIILNDYLQSRRYAEENP